MGQRNEWTKSSMRATVIALAVLFAGHAQAEEIKVLATGIFRGVYPIVVQQFEHSSGHKVILTTETPGVLKQKLLAGVHADVVIAISPIMKDIEQAGAINDPRGGSNIGRFVMALAERFDFDAETRSRLKLVPGGGDAVAKTVLNGDADFGITISSEILSVKGMEISGPLPPDMNELIVGYGFLVPGTNRVEAGTAFLTFLRSEETKRLLKAHGIDPS